jgi:hypothetical protein
MQVDFHGVFFFSLDGKYPLTLFLSHGGERIQEKELVNPFLSLEGRG